MPHDWHCLLSIWKLQYYKTYFHSFIKKLSDLFRSYAKVVNGDRPWQGCPAVLAKKSHPSGVFFRPKPCMGGSRPVHGPCLRNGTKSNKTSKKVYSFFGSVESKNSCYGKEKDREGDRTDSPCVVVRLLPATAAAPARLASSGKWAHLLCSETALETARSDSGHRHRLFSVL